MYIDLILRAAANSTWSSQRSEPGISSTPSTLESTGCTLFGSVEMLCAPNGGHPMSGATWQRLVVPPNLHTEVLHKTHQGACGGHLCQVKCLNKFKNQFNCLVITQMLVNWCQTCPTCAILKIPAPRQHTALGTSYLSWIFYWDNGSWFTSAIDREWKGTLGWKLSRFLTEKQLYISKEAC